MKDPYSPSPDRVQPDMEQRLLGLFRGSDGGLLSGEKIGAVLDTVAEAR